MAAIDIFIILIAVMSILYGIKRGMLAQLGSLAGIIAGIILCRLLGGSLSETFAGNNPTADDVYISGVFTNLTLFVIGFAGVKIFAGFLKDITHSMMLSTFDRIGGGIFSFFEWFFFLSLLLNAWQAINPDRPIIESARTLRGAPAKFIMDLAPRVAGSETAHILFSRLNEISTPDGNSDDSADDPDSESESVGELVEYLPGVLL